MNKQKECVKGFVAGVLLTILLMSTVLVVANTTTHYISVTFRDISLVVNGEQIALKNADGNVVRPFIWNDKTYLPVCVMADALGQDIYWNEDTSTIYWEGRLPIASKTVIPEAAEYAELGFNFTTEYDVNGRETRMARYNIDGTINSWCEFEYDIYGNVSRYSFDSNGSLISREERDAAGWFIRKTIFNEDGLIDYWYEYVMDTDNRLIRTNFFNADGSIRNRIKHEYIGYNNYGHIIIRLTQYCADGFVEKTWYNTVLGDN